MRVNVVGQVVRGFGEKVVGLNLELAGTIFGNERLRNAGRNLEDAGGERLQAVEEEVKGAGRQAQAKQHEAREAAQQRGGGDGGRTTGAKPSPARAAAESTKGAVKEVAGKVTGSDALEEEGRQQRERGKDEGAAAKHDAKAAAHREKADAERDLAERQARNS
jgi:uncharacterized protein YjbJ (UPF0337 family)